MGNVLRVLELLSQCKNFFDIIILKFAGSLFGDSTVGLMVTSSQESLCHMLHVPSLLQPKPLSVRPATGTGSVAAADLGHTVLSTIELNR